MDALTIKHIRENKVLRMILKPIMVCYRYKKYLSYQNSEDSKYIKSLKGIHAGKRCFIVGNGPSLRAEDLEVLRDEICFACNRIYDIFGYTTWRPSYYMCVDKAIVNDMQLNNQKLEILNGSELFFVNGKFVNKLRKTIDNVHEICLKGKYEISMSKMVMHSVSEDVSNHFTLAQSVSCNMIEMAMYMGFKDIYLIGLDHSFGIEIDMKGRTVINKDVVPHFKEQKDRNTYPAQKEALTNCYRLIKEYADQKGIIIRNATRGGQLDVFPRVDFDSLFGK